MRTQVVVVTNNEKVDLWEQDRFVAGTLGEVLLICRDLIHRGHVLITHPLSGSVKPNETPYKSVVLSKNSLDRVDPASLQMIENSIQVTQVLLQNKSLPDYPENVLEDLRYIDWDLLQTALNKLPAGL